MAHVKTAFAVLIEDLHSLLFPRHAASSMRKLSDSGPRIELAGDALDSWPLVVGQPVCIRANPLIRWRGERGNSRPPQKSK